MKKTLVTLFGTLLLMPLLALANSWPDMKFPNDARVGLMAENTIHNGSPTRIYGAQFYQNMEKTAQFFKFELQKLNTLEVRESTDPTGNITLFQSDKKFMYMVQLAPQTSTSSVGTIVITAPPIKQTKIPIEIPDNTQISSDIESMDNGKYGRTLGLVSRDPYVSFRNSLIDSLKRSGFVMDGDMYDRSRDKQTETFYFSGKKREARIKVSKLTDKYNAAEVILIYETNQR